jgi:hypothetical protein
VDVRVRFYRERNELDMLLICQKPKKYDILWDVKSVKYHCDMVTPITVLS